MASTENRVSSLVPLSGGNYATWKLQCKMALMKDGVWSIVDGAEAAPAEAASVAKFNTRRDKALAIIVLSLDTSILYLIGDPSDPKTVWDLLEKQYQKKSWVNKLELRRKLYSLRLNEGDSANDHIKIMLEIFNKLSAIGDNINEEDRVVHLLASLPESFNMLVTALQSNEKVPAMELVLERLRHEEQKIKEKKSVQGEENVLLSRKNNNIKCYHCGKIGHIKRNCYVYQNEKSSNFKLNSANVSNNYRNRTKGSSDGQSEFDRSECAGFVAQHVLAVNNNNVNNALWIIDSGATCHMCNNINLLTDVVKLDEIQRVALGNDSIVHSSAKGTVFLNMLLPDNRVQPAYIREVLYVPNLSYNLLSISKTTSFGNYSSFTDSQCKIYDLQSNLIGLGKKIGNLYYLQCTIPNEFTNIAVNNANNENLWHKRFGHLGEQNLKLLSRNELVCDFNYDVSKSIEFCEPCAFGKNHRSKFPESRTRSTRVLELIHSDICGKVNSKSIGGAEYFISFIDDYSRYIWVYFIKNKSEAYSKFCEFQVMIENVTGNKIGTFRSDNGGEYISNEFESHLKLNGIVHQFTVPKTPEQNGVCERLNRTLLEMVRSMLQDCGLNYRFWAEALSTAVYLKNRSPAAHLGNCTPYERFFDDKPSVKHLRVFGCVSYVHIPKDERKKLDRKSKKCIFLGYGLNVKGYRLYDLSANKVIISRDVLFNELEFAKGSNVELCASDLNIDIITESEPEEENILEQVSEEPRDRYPTRDRRPPDFYGERVSVASSSIEPMTAKDALDSIHSDRWQEAMQKEMDNMKRNCVWSLVSPPVGKNIIKSKWVFKVKKGSDGSITEYKARLVAQGYSQVFGQDYDETFSPVVRFESIRVLMAMAVQFNLVIHQMDVTSAFLNGNLDEEIFMKQPENFIVQGKESYVCKLHKSIYGLKQSPRCWNTAIDDYLKSIGFVQATSDNCIYTASEGEMFIIAVYVDDIILACKDLERITTVKNHLSSKYKMKDMNKLQYFVGVQVVHSLRQGYIWLGQSTYCNNVLKKFNMSDCKPVDTPVETSCNLSIGDDTDELVDPELYQSCIGSLLYMSIKTRPDIAYAVGNVAKFCSKPNKTHWSAVKRILRYLKGTVNYGLLFQHNKSSELVGYSDADWAGDVNDRKSTSGYCFVINGAAVAWSSKKQTCIALSTAEAEYVALSHASQEAVWLISLHENIGRPISSSVTIYEDNQSAICISKNPQFHGRTKHVDIKFHFVRDLVESKVIEVTYCPTNEMIADSFTKGICREKFVKFRNSIGICPCD